MYKVGMATQRLRSYYFKVFLFFPQEMKHCFRICYFACSNHVLKDSGFSLFPSLDILHSCLSIESEELNWGHGIRIISFYETHSVSQFS